MRERAVFRFTKGKLRAPDPRFCIPGAAVEATFDRFAEIEPVSDEGMPPIAYTFVPLGRIQDLPPRQLVDVAGVVRQVSAVRELQSKAGKALTKREVMLGDEGACVELCLWNDTILKYDSQLVRGAAVLVRCASVSEFNGSKSLGTCPSTVLDFLAAEEHPRVRQLQQWWRGANPAELVPLPQKGFQSLSGRRVSIAELQQPVGLSSARVQPAGYAILHATVVRLGYDRPPWYMSCGYQVPGEDRVCAKKATAISGLWSCEHGHTTAAPRCKYILPLVVSDATGTLEVKAFDDVAELLLGRSADDLALSPRRRRRPSPTTTSRSSRAPSSCPGS